MSVATLPVGDVAVIKLRQEPRSMLHCFQTVSTSPGEFALSIIPIVRHAL